MTVHPQSRIRSVQVLNSGTASQHEEHRFGTRVPQWWWILMSRSWIPIPIHFFLIHHRDGPVLFDTGLDPAIATDKTYIDSALGRFLLRRIFRLDISEQDRLDRVLDRAGVAAADITRAVISHLHFDHVGGIARIPQAELLVGAREWAMLDAPHPEREWILREHIEIPGARWCPVEFTPVDDPLFADFPGVYDVAGDGSMVLLPTPGHTPGSLSMLIRNEGWAPILLVADLMYEAAMLDSGAVAGTGDRAVLLQSYARVRALRDKLPRLAIVASHDPAAVLAVRRATEG